MNSLPFHFTLLLITLPSLSAHATDFSRSSPHVVTGDDDVAPGPSTDVQEAALLLTMPAEIIRIIAHYLPLDSIQHLGEATGYLYPLEEVYYQKKFIEDFGATNNKAIQKTLKTAKRRSPKGSAEKRKYLRMKEIVLRKNIAHLREHEIRIKGTSCHCNYFETANFFCENLSAFYFCGSNLKRARFIGANLTITSLAHSDIKQACFAFAIGDEADFFSVRGLQNDFSDAELPRANFASAYLPRACFQNANLPNACFRRANIEGSNFTYANLANADFSDANIGNTDFSNANLTNADFTGAFYLLTIDNQLFKIILDVHGNEAQRVLITNSPNTAHPFLSNKDASKGF